VAVMGAEEEEASEVLQEVLVVEQEWAGSLLRHPARRGKLQRRRRGPAAATAATRPCLRYHRTCARLPAGPAQREVGL
jgi:hypothetical protein